MTTEIFMLQGHKQLYLWMAGEYPKVLFWVCVKQVRMKPHQRAELLLMAPLPSSADVVYPFPNGVTLELRDPDGKRGDVYDLSKNVISFVNCKCVESEHVDLNCGDAELFCVYLSIECDVAYHYEQT